MERDEADQAARIAANIQAILPPVAAAILGLVLTALTWSGLAVFIFFAADAYGRSHDFRYLYRQRYLNVKLVDYYGRSFCGRNVICTISPHWRSYYASRGYRWYHLMPDGFPKVIFKINFWRCLFKGHARV